MKPPHYSIHPGSVTVDEFFSLAQSNQNIQLSPKSRHLLSAARHFLEDKLANSDALFYGINTGFGSLCNIRISPSEVETLQLNLVKSHATGMGDEVPDEIVQLILLLKIQSLSYGYSAVRPEVVERLIAFFNHNLSPVIYRLGSLGASGDLAPLAHMSLPLLGLGDFRWKGERLSAKAVNQRMGWQALTLQAKEGVALLNGTQFSTAYALWCVAHGKRLMQWANRCAALSIDAFHGQIAPFDERLHQIRPHAGQVKTAAAIRDLLKGSQIIETPKEAVQDPYAFRCVPQVHGASWDTLDYVEKIVETEINSVTDNPNVFFESDAIISGGNFHAQPIALAMDFLAIALAELGSIAERRIYQLISGQRGLPVFLSKNAGLESGMMILQYTAASIVSQNKQLCTPASVDSIVSCNGQEDHVSMAANAATKCYRVVQNLERLLALEWMIAAQALEFRRPLRTSAALENLWATYRTHVPFLAKDRMMKEDLDRTLMFLKSA